MHEKDTVCGLIDFSFSYCFYRSGLVVLLTPIYPDTYTAFAINAYWVVIVKNRSNVFTPGERCLPTLLKLLRNLDSQLASSGKFQGGTTLRVRQVDWSDNSPCVNAGASQETHRQVVRSLLKAVPQPVCSLQSHRRLCFVWPAQRLVHWTLGTLLLLPRGTIYPGTRKQYWGINVQKNTCMIAHWHHGVKRLS